MALPRGPRHDEREAEREKVRTLLCERAYLLGPEGIQVVDIHSSPLGARAETKGREVFGVRVERVGPAHVTVHVRTVWGDIAMPWLPRTAALFDVLRTIADRPDAPWTAEVVIPDAD